MTSATEILAKLGIGSKATVVNGWTIERKPNLREGRHDVWWVTCPNDPELTWSNDFGRGMYCGCRRFPSEGKATRYVERMTAAAGQNS